MNAHDEDTLAGEPDDRPPGPYSDEYWAGVDAVAPASNMTVAFAHGVAVAAHAGQVDRDDRPHIEHVARVVEAVHNGPHTGAAVLATAWLHDAVEDGRVTLDDLVLHVPNIVLVAVHLLTGHPRRGTYQQRIEALADDSRRSIGPALIARTVKIADLEDNLARCKPKDTLRKRYTRALATLQAAVPIDTKTVA